MTRSTEPSGNPVSSALASIQSRSGACARIAAFEETSELAEPYARDVAALDDVGAQGRGAEVEQVRPLRQQQLDLALSLAPEVDQQTA